MESAQDLSEDDKLRVVNDFFNQLRFLDDVALWGVSDYWTTPFEFLVKNGGDCEDFAIAKYFTLIHVGVPEERLRLTYVKALDYDQAHMVLTYFATPRATPLVLDNLNPHILPATERADLQPVYSFNGTGLWLAKSAGSGKRVGGAERLDLWRDLQSRMPSMAPDAPGR
nr:transglutaminase-like cysteine peptidase [Allochromatium palmeri]